MQSEDASLHTISSNTFEAIVNNVESSNICDNEYVSPEGVHNSKKEIYEPFHNPSYGVDMKLSELGGLSMALHN